jgi:hypothetical protein
MSRQRRRNEQLKCERFADRAREKALERRLEPPAASIALVADAPAKPRRKAKPTRGKRARG